MLISTLETLFILGVVADALVSALLVLEGRKLHTIPRVLRDTRTHHALATTALILTGAAVGIVEALVRLGGFPKIDWMLFYVHLPFAVTWVVTLVLMRFVFTGEKNPRVHRKLAYVFMGATPVAAITGLMLFCGY